MMCDLEKFKCHYRTVGFIILMSLFSNTVTVDSIRTCSTNEVCINVKSCASFNGYMNKSFKEWPMSVRELAKASLCRKETIDGVKVLSVCCTTELNSKKCGKQSGDKIAFGNVANAFDFPWMALLQSKGGSFLCGGSLISSRHVLTAAHCFRNQKSMQIVSVRLGENDIDKPIDCIVTDGEEDCAGEPQDIEVAEIILHPDYSARQKKNDIALIRLKQPAVLSFSVSPICLPNGTPEQRAIVPSFFIVSGWGFTENATKSSVLRYARVPAISQENCTEVIQRLDKTGIVLDQGVICAGGEGRVDNCAGDSGGPLQYICKHSSLYVQYGIVAFGLKSCGKESEPGVYTNVAHYLDWIAEQVSK